MLLVTVDPNRDTAPVLSAYVKNFGTEIDGLRGTPDELAALARRYRVEYSVTPASGSHPYDVTHSSAIFVFDGSGAARLIDASLASTTPDVAGTTADLKPLSKKTIRPACWRGWSNGFDTGYFPVAPRTGKLALKVAPLASRKVTDTDFPGAIAGRGDMHIR